jgi:hypothetical protein
LLLLPSEWFALIAMLLLCGHVVTGPCIRTDVRSVCPVGLHVDGVLVICSRGTRVLVSLGKGEALTYPLGRVPTPVSSSVHCLARPRDWTMDPGMRGTRCFGMAQAKPWLTSFSGV